MKFFSLLRVRLANAMDPDWGFNNPKINCKKVDLPHPLAPVIATTSPWFNEKFKDSIRG
jgi:hypothetical protein